MKYLKEFIIESNESINDRVFVFENESIKLNFSFEEVEFYIDEFRVWGSMSVKDSIFYGYLFGFPYAKDSDDLNYEASLFYKKNISNSIIKSGDSNMSKTHHKDLSYWITNLPNKTQDEIFDWFCELYNHYCKINLKNKPFSLDYFLEMFSDLIDSDWNLRVGKNIFYKIGDKEEKHDYIVDISKKIDNELKSFRLDRSVFKNVSDSSKSIEDAISTIESHGDLFLSGIRIKNEQGHIFPYSIYLSFKDLRS